MYRRIGAAVEPHGAKSSMLYGIIQRWKNPRKSAMNLDQEESYDEIRMTIISIRGVSLSFRPPQMVDA